MLGFPYRCHSNPCFEDRLRELSAEGDPLERLSATVNFERFRPVLAKALRRSDPRKGGRPYLTAAFDFDFLSPPSSAARTSSWNG